jgi:LPPG:FO 2-phospho-L-lactate transferase
MLSVLAGGVGAAKFLEGLAAARPSEETTVIVNTGDDTEMHGLYVCPDIDTILYTLTGFVDRERGWGLAGDTFRCLEGWGRLGLDSWFQLGDQDIATHLYRAERLREGAKLSEVTHELRQRLAQRTSPVRSVPCILPMTDDPAPTYLKTSAGVLAFQEYFVKLRCEPEVLELDLDAAARCEPAPGVIEAIRGADAVIVAPSNPLISISPILAVPGVRDALRSTKAPIAAISPIIGGKALKGPAARMMASLGHGSSAAAVAELYRDFIDVFVLDTQDVKLQPEIERKEMRVAIAQTIMNSAEAKQQLALGVLEALPGNG